MMKANELRELYARVREGYRFDGSIDCPDEPKVRRIKWVMDNVLTEHERNLLILYCETASLRELGQKMDVSYGTVGIAIRKIKKKIKANL